MKRKPDRILRLDLDPNDPQPLTARQITELAALATRPDSAIDYGDIPPLTEDFWKNAERRRLYKPLKRQITARIDADVLEWFQSKGRGYQTRINAVLRSFMEAQSRER